MYRCPPSIFLKVSQYHHANLRLVCYRYIVPYDLASLLLYFLTRSTISFFIVFIVWLLPFRSPWSIRIHRLIRFLDSIVCTLGRFPTYPFWFLGFFSRLSDDGFRSGTGGVDRTVAILNCYPSGIGRTNHYCRRVTGYSRKSILLPPEYLFGWVPRNLVFCNVAFVQVTSQIVAL